MKINRDYRRELEDGLHRGLGPIDVKNKMHSRCIAGVCFIILFFLIVISAFADVDTSHAVIHHTASGDVSAAEIDRWHKERGWDGIGYNFVIRKDGSVEVGRSLRKNGAHAKGRNHYLGIALTGNETFTEAQIKSLLALLKKLDVKFVERHHEKCPGRGIDVEKIQKQLK